MKHGSGFSIFLLACMLFGIACANGADFKQGDGVTLMRDEPLYFKNAVYRQGSKGEKFTVYSQNAATHKVFLLTKDDKGQPIALNISEDALAVLKKTAPKASPSTTPVWPKGPGGFLGMPWGTPPHIARKVMESRQGVSFDSNETSPESLIFAGGTFFEHPVDFTYLTFLDSKLIDGTIAFKFTGHMEGLFSVMLDALTAKYGQGKGFVTSGRIEWKFPDAERPEEVSLYITSDKRDVLITYGILLSPEQTELLRRQKEEKRKKKDGTNDL